MSDSETNMNNALEQLHARIGEPNPSSDWFEITQDRVNDYADVSMDHQWIHVDVDRASEGPFGAPIAHGNLTIAVMGHLPTTQSTRAPSFEGHKLSINYGFDKVRFINPVKVGSRVRVHSLLSKVELKGSAIQQTRTMTVEIDGETKPALVADWLTRSVYA